MVAYGLELLAPDWISARSYGAAGDGTTDDTKAIQNALDAASSGQCVYLPDGTYATSSALSVPSGVEIAGSHGSKHNLTGTVIKPLSSFSGTGVLVLAAGSEQRITRINIDGSQITAASVAGIDGSTNAAAYVQLTDVAISGSGIATGVSQQSGSNGWRCRGVYVTGTSAAGFLVQSPDNDFELCQALSCGTHGWSVNGAQNSRFTACQADFNGDYGFYVQGSWPTGAGSGGCQFTGCTTDRNADYGVLVTATGNSPIVFTNLATRRDGSAGAGGGLRVSNATCPVIVSGYQCYPGVNDDGTGTDSPATGISLNGTNTFVSVDNALVHAVTTAISGTLTSSRALATRTGSTSSPSSITLAADSA